MTENQQRAEGFGSCSFFIQTGRTVFPVGAVAALAHILSKRRRKRNRHTDLKLCWGLLDVIFVGFLLQDAWNVSLICPVI